MFSATVSCSLAIAPTTTSAKRASETSPHPRVDAVDPLGPAPPQLHPDRDRDDRDREDARDDAEHARRRRRRRRRSGRSARPRKSGTVTIAPTLLIAVIVTESAVSPRARWVSMLAIIPPGEAPSRTRPTASSGDRPNSSAIVERQQRRDQRQVEHPDRDPARRDEDAPEVGRGQRQPEAAHDHRDRGRQQRPRSRSGLSTRRTLIGGGGRHRALRFPSMPP